MKTEHPNIDYVYIGYKKLNQSTIPDTYPMQETSVILKNLGKAKYFSRQSI